MQPPGGSSSGAARGGGGVGGGGGAETGCSLRLRARYLHEVIMPLKEYTSLKEVSAQHLHRREHVSPMGDQVRGRLIRSHRQRAVFSTSFQPPVPHLPHKNVVYYIYKNRYEFYI